MVINFDTFYNFRNAALLQGYEDKDLEAHVKDDGQICNMFGIKVVYSDKVPENEIWAYKPSQPHREPFRFKTTGFGQVNETMQGYTGLEITKFFGMEFQ